MSVPWHFCLKGVWLLLVLELVTIARFIKHPLELCDVRVCACVCGCVLGVCVHPRVLTNRQMLAASWGEPEAYCHAVAKHSSHGLKLYLCSQ